MNRETILAALAAIACTLGIFLTADSFIQAPKLADVMKRKYADMDRLLALQDARAGDLAAVAAFDQLPGKKPAPLAELATAALPGARPAIPSTPPYRWPTHWRTSMRSQPAMPPASTP